MKENSDVKVERDVIYGKAGNETLRLDIFHPPGDDKTPASTRAAVLLLHGGGWSAGAKEDFDDVSLALARAGFVAFAASYRLVKDGKNAYPAALDDVQRAVRWIRSRAALYGIDPEWLGALGGSAGGHLAALLGTRDTRDNSDKTLAKFSSRVNCVVNLNGPTDLTAPLDKIASEGDLNVEALLTSFIAQPLSNVEAYRAASPLFFIDRKTVPFLLAHGSDDSIVPVSQSQKFHEALQENGTCAQLVIYQGEGHGFAKPENAEDFIRRAIDFLHENLRPQHPAP